MGLVEQIAKENGLSEGDVEFALDEAIHELMSSRAARINNEGIESQLDTLLESHSYNVDVVADVVKQYATP